MGSSQHIVVPISQDGTVHTAADSSLQRTDGLQGTPAEGEPPAPTVLTPPVAPVAPGAPSMPAGVSADQIPEKYRRPDGTVDWNSILVRHGQLETAMGAQVPAPVVDPAAPPPAPVQQLLTPDALRPFVHEHNQTGRLSEASYTNLEKNFNMSREMVDHSISTERAAMQLYYNGIKEAAGGADAYQSAADWAQSHLQPHELAYFETEIHSGDAGKAHAAVKQLVGQYRQSAAGPAAGLIQGSPGAPPVPPGAIAFTSNEEAQEAMRKPDPDRPGQLLYNTTTAYRRSVDQAVMQLHRGPQR